MVLTSARDLIKKSTISSLPLGKNYIKFAFSLAMFSNDALKMQKFEHFDGKELVKTL